MTQNSKKMSVANVEQREKTFDEYYNERFVETGDKMKRIDIVYEQLKHKYADYEATQSFMEYLRSVEKVFAQAEKEKWSVEKTEDEMINGEIYIMSQMTGIDEGIFRKIYESFQQASHDVEKIQIIASELLEKYSNIEDCFECEDCKEFIAYVRESLFVFAKTFTGDENFDEIGEVKEQLIAVQMKTMAIDGKPPLEILQDIYSDFMTALKE